MSKQTYSATLDVVSCPKCGMTFGVPEDFAGELRRTHDTFYCPAGHRQYFPGESDVEKAKREAKELRNALAREQHRAEQARAALRDVERGMTPELRYAHDLARSFRRTQLSAYWKGFQARECGVTEGDCPYPNPRGGHQYAWLVGFRQSEGEEDPADE